MNKNMQNVDVQWNQRSSKKRKNDVLSAIEVPNKATLIFDTTKIPGKMLKKSTKIPRSDHDMKYVSEYLCNLNQVLGNRNMQNVDVQCSQRSSRKRKNEDASERVAKKIRSIIDNIDRTKNETAQSVLQMEFLASQLQYLREMDKKLLAKIKTGIGAKKDYYLKHRRSILESPYWRNDQKLLKQNEIGLEFVTRLYNYLEKVEVEGKGADFPNFFDLPIDDFRKIFV